MQKIRLMAKSDNNRGKRPSKNFKGGGYILGFTQDLERAKKALEGHNLEVVYNF